MWIKSDRPMAGLVRPLSLRIILHSPQIQTLVTHHVLKVSVGCLWFYKTSLKLEIENQAAMTVMAFSQINSRGKLSV